MDAGLALILATGAVGDAAERLGVVAAALLAAGAVLAPAPRARALAALGALALTPVLLVAEIWDAPQLQPIRENAGLALGAGAGGLAAVALLALLMDRRPAAFPLLAVAALPFRVPIAAGGSTSNLLVPLYAVVAAGVLAYAVPRLRGRPRPADRAPGRLEWLLLGAVVLYAAQASYSTDFSKALEQIVFFYVPFALLFMLLGRIAWTPRLTAACFGVVVALALAFAGIGFAEYQARELLLNPKVINANEFESYFRVNSLFFDPNIYGRFLALVMLGLAAALMWTARGRTVAPATAALLVLWGGLVLTFSQSSFGALLVGLAALGALRWNARRAVAIAGGAVVVGAVFVALFPGSVRLDLESSRSIDRATSGRYDLVRGGADLFAARPLTGWGPGAFAREYRRAEKASNERAASASHTIPVTVAAEQGVPGLALYLALLAAAFALLFRGARANVARAAVAAAFAALVFHTMLYAAFLEDPLAWTLLGVGAALARPRPEP